MQTIVVSDNVANTLKHFSMEEMEQYVLTENGLTVAQEMEILRREQDTDNIDSMTPQEFLNELKELHNEE